MAEQLLAQRPRIIGLGVYIWNVEETTRLVALLKDGRAGSDRRGRRSRSELRDRCAAHLRARRLRGDRMGRPRFPALCGKLLAASARPSKSSPAVQPPLSQIRLPYSEFTEEDIAQRFLYVEASRGCPFKCEFCLSSLDKTAWAFRSRCIHGASSRRCTREARGISGSSIARSI